MVAKSRKIPEKSGVSWNQTHHIVRPLCCCFKCSVKQVQITEEVNNMNSAMGQHAPAPTTGGTSTVGSGTWLPVHKYACAYLKKVEKYVQFVCAILKALAKKATPEMRMGFEVLSKPNKIQWVALGKTGNNGHNSKQ